MAALSVVLVCFLTVGISTIAFAVECPACSSVIGSGKNKCDGDEVETIRCAADLDRCMTVDFKMTGSESLELKNCSNSFLCDPGSEFYYCKDLNTSTDGAVSECKVTCYEPSKSVRVLFASAILGVILLVFILHLL